MINLEEQLSQFWKETTFQESIDVKANFFEAGGTSLNIVQMYAMLEEYYPAIVNIDDIFSNPTIEALANLIRERTVGVDAKTTEVEF